MAATLQRNSKVTTRTQATYRIVPQSVILYGVEKTESDNAPRVLLTCPTEAAADAWISEITRLSAAKSPLRQFD
jgi:hypothetical protein